MPELFGNLPCFFACVVIMAVAQLIYATVGFGAGLFAVSLMALVLPDLTDIVVVLLMLTVVTEVCVLARAWRQARVRLLGWLVPGMAVGLWLGTQVLLTTKVGHLKQILGVVVVATGLYFVIENRVRARKGKPVESVAGLSAKAAWISLPIGFLSGILGALFGTGGPPVIVFLQACRLDKSAFRSTILMYFFLMSLLRAAEYTRVDLMTVDRVWAAALLLPGSLAGVVIGTIIHDRISERRFAQVVSLLLVVLGALLVAGAGR